MPSLDISRSRFRLADDHLIVLCELAAGNEVPEDLATARKELVDSGLINPGGELVHALLPLLKTVLNPGVVITLEAGGRQGELRHGMLIGEDHVVAHEAWPGTDEAEYSLVQPKMLVWKLADMVNLQQSPASHGTALSLLDTTVGTVEAGLAGLDGASRARSGEEERALVHRSLTTGGTLAEPSATHLAELICELRSSWRMTAAWRGTSGEQPGVSARGFAVWDCGPLGYWLRELPEEPVPAERITSTSPFRLVRVDAKTIWTRITELLPDQSEIRPAASPGA
ncbi:histidine kinase [Streptomyces sp. NPDC093595]|uniref:histidine kinase n=1 Tax=Streptomyces sp. NPDC093595 TaxID=3366045 RepID=UPI003823FE5D